MSSRKRKHRSGQHRDFVPRRNSSPPEVQFLGHHESYQQSLQDQEQSQDNLSDFLRPLCIQAHEADVIHGPSAETAAQSLEVFEYRSFNEDTVEVVPKVGSALIQWGNNSAASNAYDNYVGNEDDSVPTFGKDAQTEVWVDRYDVRLLLDTTKFTPADDDHAPPASPTGWSDIPSDAEDTFFFTPAEMDEFQREKRRRLLEKSREERLKARLQEDGIDGEVEDQEVWGDSDEEPDDVQKELMRRTAAHLSSSPNPAQLEMRILANHGSDRRFAFLRGRWKRAWHLAKAKVRAEKEQEIQASGTKAPGLGVLAGYGSDSDDHSSTEGNGNGEDAPEKSTLPNEEAPLPSASETPKAIPDSDEMAREARRKRLKLWAERRKATRDAAE